MKLRAIDHQQQQHADDPVELARRLVGPVVEDPHHVQEDEEDHEVGAPAVDVPGQQPERHAWTGWFRMSVYAEVDDGT